MSTPDVVPVALDIGAAMRKAFHLGQTYWQQSDSDFVSQHKKSEVTLKSFNVLTAEAKATVDALQESAEESDAVCTKLSELLARVAIAIKGEPPHLTLWSFHDLPELVGTLAIECEIQAEQLKTLQSRIDELEKEAAIKVQPMSTLDPLDVAHLHDLILKYLHAHSMQRRKARREIVDFVQAHDAALRARIDELEAQLFIVRAEPVFEAMGFGPMPAFPSIRTNQIER